MYRAPAARDTAELPAPELVYDVVWDDDRKLSVWRAVVPIGLFGGLAAIVTWLEVASPVINGAALVGTTLASAWWWRRGGPDRAIVVRVDDGALSLRPRSAKLPSASVRLADILDVTLDNERIERFEDGTSAVTAKTAAGLRLADVERLHVMFICSEGDPVLLGPVAVPRQEAIVWLGKVRVFLRKHGWLPEDERAASSSQA